jgi:hypothetical protein
MIGHANQRIEAKRIASFCVKCRGITDPEVAAFIAYERRVYDVSGSFLWQNGRHEFLRPAGTDLTVRENKVTFNNVELFLLV